MENAERQRLDKWLWFARVVKTRTLAAKLVSEGAVRVNQVKADAASKTVKPGDVLTIALERDVRVLKVLGPGASRRPYEEARQLYEDLTPAPPPEEERPLPQAQREPGSGRPTGRERRVMDKYLGGGED